VTALVFVDCETTGLDPDRHEVYEIGLIDGNGAELHLWINDAPLATAEPTALRIGRYYQRWPHREQTAQLQRSPIFLGVPYNPWLAQLPKPYIVDGKTAAWIVAAATAGAHLIGAVPSFDAAFLDRLLRRHNLVPAWHYRLVCVEALAAGKLGIPPPWDSNELAARAHAELSDDPLEVERHTALGDARWARAIYDAVMGGAA
jgi:oligoribonuclease (3'-5' exoribonuclease)